MTPHGKPTGSQPDNSLGILWSPRGTGETVSAAFYRCHYRMGNAFGLMDEEKETDDQENHRVRIGGHSVNSGEWVRHCAGEIDDG